MGESNKLIKILKNKKFNTKISFEGFEACIKAMVIPLRRDDRAKDNGVYDSGR